MRRSFDEQLLCRLRQVPLLDGLTALGRHVAVDRDFVPVKDVRTERWFVDAGCGKAELLVTRLKWFDTREQCGGGGMIDLLMHLDKMSFVQAVKLLNRSLGRVASEAASSSG